MRKPYRAIQPNFSSRLRLSDRCCNECGSEATISCIAAAGGRTAKVSAKSETDRVMEQGCSCYAMYRCFYCTKEKIA